MNQSLAVKFRPPTLDDIIGQDTLVKILKQQLATGNISHSYIFCGPSGDGKTTASRAFHYALNKGKGQPEELDAASHSGVESMRELVASAKERAIDCEYKVIIVDEAHALSAAAWQSLLKPIEEPSPYTIFIFCTTNPEKIPATIVNRCTRFNLTKIDTGLIRNRLEYICQQEGFINYTEACDFIAKAACGGMRDAISMLEKCASYDVDLSIQNVLNCLGDFSFDSFFDLTCSLYNQDEAAILSIVENYFNSGKDLKIFIEKYLDFCLDLVKYCLFQSMDSVAIPLSLESRCKGYASIPESLDYSNKLVERILEVKNMIRHDTNNKTTIEAMLISFCRGA